MKNVLMGFYILALAGQSIAQNQLGNEQHGAQQINPQVNINEDNNPQIQVAMNNNVSQSGIGYNEPVVQQIASEPVQVTGNVNWRSTNLSSGYSGSSGFSSGTVRHHSHKSRRQSVFIKKLFDKNYKPVGHYKNKSRVRRCHKF